MPGDTKRANQMGKKYLDTKQSTIEASVLDVWAKSSEEQEAIRNAAKMIAQEKMDTKSEGWFKDLVDKKTGARASSRNVHGTGTGHNIPALKQYNKEVDLAKKQGRNWKPGTKGAPKVPQEYKLPHQK